MANQSAILPHSAALRARYGCTFDLSLFVHSLGPKLYFTLIIQLLFVI